MTVVQQETVHQVGPRVLVQVLAIESQAVRMPQSCGPVTCDKRPSALDYETCCGSFWTSRSQTLDGPRKVSKHQSTPPP